MFIFSTFSRLSFHDHKFLLFRKLNIFFHMYCVLFMNCLPPLWSERCSLPYISFLKDTDVCISVSSYIFKDIYVYVYGTFHIQILPYGYSGDLTHLLTRHWDRHSLLYYYIYFIMNQKKKSIYVILFLDSLLFFWSVGLTLYQHYSSYDSFIIGINIWWWK